jgi:hypothetical protein
MAIHRLKQNFTGGEVAPMLYDRTDFKRFTNGSKILQNMVCVTQGPVTRRSGFRFIYDLEDLGLDTTDPIVRMVEFIFNEVQAYTLIFFSHTSGTPRVVFATGSGLVVYPDPPTNPCGGSAPLGSAGEIVYLPLDPDFDIEAFDHAQSGDELYIAQTGLEPHAIVRYEHDCWTFEQLTFTDQPSDWTSGYGWPETVTFHQQRLAYGGNLLRRQTVWMSKAGDFGDFGVSSPIVDSDAVTFTLDSGTQNKILWMLSGKALNIGTQGNEWTVTGSSQVAITATDLSAVRQTNNGSEKIKALMVGLTTLFVERHGRVINEFVYDYTVDSYKAADITVLAPHLTEFYSITDWAYQQSPHSIIWCVRSDGALIALTYQRQHKVVGWHRHTTDGEFKTLATIPGSEREDEVWAVVKREIDGSDKYYVEKMDNFFNADEAEDGRFLDSYVVYSGADTDTVTGLDHLEGKSVGVLGSGMVHPDTTVTSGSITLDKVYSAPIVIGLNFTSEVRPLLQDIMDTQGTFLGRQQVVKWLDIHFYRTTGCIMGKINPQGEEVTEEIPFRRPYDLTGQALPLTTKTIRASFMEGYSNEMEWFLRQEQPLPFTIVSVVDTLEVTE